MNCPSCGTENPEGSHFCGECGTPLPTAAAPPPPPPAAAPPPPAEPVPPTEPVPVTPAPPPPPPSEPTAPGGTAPFPAAPPAGPPPGEPPSYVAAPPPGGEGPRRSKKGLVIGLVALLVAAAAVGSFLVLGGDDETGAGDGQIVLEPIGVTLRDDFAGNLDLDTPGASLAIALPDVPPLGSNIGSALAGRTASGDEPGLYGGTRDVAVCDVEQLVDFLTDEENADKAEAWAEVHGIEVDEIEDFIRGLTAVRLRFDTRVTNHGFTDGSANGFQSILERGTAVLVDDEGVPRVKCNCGNPLVEPEEAGDLDEEDALDLSALAQNPDDAWDDLDPEDVVTIEAGAVVEAFTLVDLDSGELFARPVGTNGDADTDADLDALCEVFADSPSCGEEPPDEETTTTTEGGEETTTTSTTIELGTGDVQVTLEWGSDADLDLAVTDPNGEQVSFGSPGPNSTGGELDVDSNIGCSGDGSVENVFWPPGQAPAGAYTVEVTGFTVDSCSQGPQSGDYVLTIRVAGQDDQVIRDSVAEGETDSFEFAL